MDTLLFDSKGLFLVNKRKYKHGLLGVEETAEAPRPCKAFPHEGNQKWTTFIILVRHVVTTWNFEGYRGFVDLGICENATVADVLENHRRRRKNHRVSLLNEVEEEILTLRQNAYLEDDIVLWKQADNKYAAKFSTTKTWEQIRDPHPVCNWSKSVWLSQSTPKYSLQLWIALRGRLQTLDRMQQWSTGLNTTCVLCSDTQESCSHLLFECCYSGQIWKKLVGDLMQNQYCKSG